ncbi:MAG TPA: tyrosine-type recombinase/integrase, partial [bacterium]|nr:tyrosine-type recombinase/integrase [bacterium]
TEQAESRAMFGDEYRADLDLVFCTMQGRPLDTNNLRRTWRQVLTKAKVPLARLHDLRHGLASYLIGLGTDINTASRILGHASSEFTLQRYVHSTDETSALKRAALAKVEAQLFRG